MAVAATAEITGALLVFALLVTPAATAQLLTARPALGLALSVVLAFLVTWLGLAIAYFSPYPVGFWVTSPQLRPLRPRPPRRRAPPLRPRSSFVSQRLTRTTAPGGEGVGA